MRPRKRWLSTGAGVAAVVFAATATVALATDNLHPHQHRALVPLVAPTSTEGAPAASSGADVAAGSAATPGFGLGAVVSSGLGPPGAVGFQAPPVAASGAVTAPGSASSGGATAASAPTTTVPRVVVVSGILSTFAFGSQVGLPLLCGVAVGAVGQLLTEPALAKVATTIAASCAQFGNQGSAALAAMNEQLGALAAADPAVDPVLTQLAGIFNGAAGDQSVPFAAELAEVAGIINFFAG